jgi:hypothetical protein
MLVDTGAVLTEEQHVAVTSSLCCPAIGSFYDGAGKLQGGFEWFGLKGGEDSGCMGSRS